MQMRLGYKCSDKIAKVLTWLKLRFPIIIADQQFALIIFETRELRKNNKKFN
jgi:hypothetical protein